MEFIMEEIEDERDTDDLDLGLDLDSSSPYPDWKLSPNVECRVMLKRIKSLHTEKELQRYSDEIGDKTTDTRSENNCSVNKSCGVYRKLKLLVDVLKNCEKRENCGLCEKYIQQLQQHLVLTHGNNTRDIHEENSKIETTTSVSEPTSINPTVEQNAVDAVDPSNISENEFVPFLTIGRIRTEDDGGEPFSQNEDNNTIKCQSISKVGKSKPFKCETCGKCFLTFYDLTQHKSEHVDDTRNIQKTSKKLFQTSSGIIQPGPSPGNQEHHHLSRHSTILKDKETYDCNTGGKKFYSGKKPFQCDVCKKVFTKYANLNRHKLIHTREKPFKCDVCKKTFNRHCILTLHRLTHTREKPFKCDVCGKSFTRDSHLAQHKMTHTGEKPYECDECEKTFTQYSNLKVHKLIHTGEKPFKCDVCGRSFTRYSHLAQHKLTHTGEKPYECDECEKAFTHYSSLKVHKLVHTGEKHFKCDVCHKAFIKYSSLNVHKRIHTGEKPFKCDVCEKAFTRYSSLSMHKLLHTGEKPYKCELCGKHFTQNGQLLRHILIHTGEKPYKCEVCGKRFKSLPGLCGHKLIHTQDRQ